MSSFNKLGRLLWRLQFQDVHAITAHVVAWDHRHALKALGMKPEVFHRRCLQAWGRYQDRLEKQVAAIPAGQGTSSVPAPVFSPDR